MEIIVVVDVFRAFTTACYVLENNPKAYYLTNRCAVIQQLSESVLGPILIGKPEIGSEVEYTIPNSPTRTLGVDMSNRVVLHRTAAGGSGVLAVAAEKVLAAGFVNADATVALIKTLSPSRVRIIPMGHEGTTPSLEDDLCARYIDGLIKGKKIDISPFIPELKKGAGKYFFGKDQEQYPREDFERCLKLNRFNFAIIAEVQGDFAILRQSDSVSEEKSNSSISS